MPRASEIRLDFFLYLKRFIYCCGERKPMAMDKFCFLLTLLAFWFYQVLYINTLTRKEFVSFEFKSVLHMHATRINMLSPFCIFLLGRYQSQGFIYLYSHKIGKMLPRVMYHWNSLYYISYKHPRAYWRSSWLRKYPNARHLLKDFQVFRENGNIYFRVFRSYKNYRNF